MRLKYRLFAVLFLGALVFLGSMIPGLSQAQAALEAKNQDGTARVGMIEGAASNDSMETIRADVRFQVFIEFLKIRGISAKVEGIKIVDYPEGYSATFLPIFTKASSEAGSLIIKDDQWNFGFYNDAKFIETYRVVLGADHRSATIEFAPSLVRESQYEIYYDDSQLDPRKIMGPKVVAASSSYWGHAYWSCSYVLRYGVNFGCFSDDNPWAFYYTIVTRYGYNLDSRFPSWYGCYKGGMHVCPQIQTDVRNRTRCGFPPWHPAG